MPALAPCPDIFQTGDAKKEFNIFSGARSSNQLWNESQVGRDVRLDPKTAQVIEGSPMNEFPVTLQDTRRTSALTPTLGSQAKAYQLVLRAPRSVARTASSGLILSGSQVLVACTVVLCVASMSIWFLRYWLFSR